MAVTLKNGTVLYTGKVLGFTTRTAVRIMSDVYADIHYAEYWDAAAGAIARHAVSNTEFGGNGDVAVVDADAATYEKAFTSLVDKAYAGYVASLDRSGHLAAARANELAKGKHVEVTKGRKVPKGTKGEVIWLGEGHYGVRAGVKDAAGTVHWTAASNLTVLDGWDHFDPEPFLLTPARVEGYTRAALRDALADVAARGWVPANAVAIVEGAAA